MSTDWRTVAAPGTDPSLLAAVVERLSRSGGATALGRELRGASARSPHASPTDLFRAVVPPTLGCTAGEVPSTWRRLAVRACLAGDPAYPARLTAGWPATGGPPLLAVRGAAPLPDGATVAIVGARRATSYGTGVAAWLAEAAAAAGAVVISGGAVGIDAAAHGAASDQRTLVVLGCGHDVTYPRPHAAPGGLFSRVLDGGGWLISEHLPGARPVARHVRARNRIVAGLADVVVVVEGGARSGALITAGYAAEQGVPVMAVPGDVRRPGSAAPHLLLREGAAPCAGPDDLLAALPVGDGDHGPSVGAGSSDAGSPPATTLPSEVHRHLASHWPRPVRLDDLADATGVAAARLLAHLTRARVAGEVAEGADGVRLTRAPAR